MRTLWRRSAFTLIELLIVVAIIAILTAIAMPNFLEAQTRSKIAAVQAGMRTVATGLEAYAVDNNVHPFTLNDNDQVMHRSGQMRMAFVPISLTTPIAYISEVPLDDFFPRVMVQLVEDQPHVHRHSYIYLNQGNTPAAALRGYRAKVESKPAAEVKNTPWALYSTGPDKTYSTMQMLMNDTAPPLYGLMYKDTTSAVRYDPTNGTISQGDLVRFFGE